MLVIIFKNKRRLIGINIHQLLFFEQTDQKKKSVFFPPVMPPNYSKA
jgi:hypothetical protein